MNNKKLIFIVAAPRSGSTLLLSYLCGIPNTKVLYETRLLNDIYYAQTYTEGLEKLASYFDSIEEEIVIEKTPEHCFQLDVISDLRLICKRDIYVVYIVRPPVPTILSLLKASKDSPQSFGYIDILGACEKYEDSLINIYNNLILKTNKPNSPITKIPSYSKNNLDETIQIDSYRQKVIIPYSFCVNYRELIDDSYRTLKTLLSSLYIEVNIQSLIDNRITNVEKYLPLVSTEKHHSNVLREIEEVEVERRAKISKQIDGGFSKKYIEKSKYIRNYFEHPKTKETIYDLVVNSKVLEVNKNPEVYVVIPLYNKEKYIEETLFSIVNQTYKNIRVVIIDDASTDSSVSVVEEFIDSLSLELSERFHLVRCHNNQGVSSIRNKGLAICTDIITFCDADDIWDSTLVEKSVETFIKYPNVDCVYSRVLDKKEDIVSKNRAKICNGDVFQDAIQYNFLGCGSNLFIKSEVINDNNIEFNISYTHCEDWDFLIQLSKVAVFKCTKEYLVTYRRLKDSLSSNRESQVAMGKNILQRYVLDKKEYKKIFTRLFCYYISSKNFTRDNTQDLDFKFIIGVFLNKFKNFVKLYLP